mmetsp:Transcript_565/g.1089  ORF Transcript_565/g.1089 Transcript_565/m.1089 type:complete len:118 (+) Transcript_565:175-528(+)
MDNQAIDAKNSKIVFEENILQLSQFYINQKKGTSQKKLFEIKLYSADANGKQYPLGTIDFDMSHFVRKQLKPVELSLISADKWMTQYSESEKIKDCRLRFKITIVEPNDLDDQDRFQ